MVPGAVAIGDTDKEKKLFKAMKDKGIKELPGKYPIWQKSVYFPLRSEAADGPLSHLPKEALVASVRRSTMISVG